MKKKLIPCIFLKDNIAVSYFDNLIVKDMDTVSLCKKFSDDHADEILIFDLSKDDASHEASLDMIKSICSAVNVPVIGAGNVKRMEDIKKLLYAGCKRAVLNFSKQENVDILKEVSDKFGKDKIIVSIKNPEDFRNNIESIKTYSNCCLLIEPELVKEEEFKTSGVRFITRMPEVALDKLIEYLNIENVEGITGNIVNENSENFTSIREIVNEKVTPFSLFKLNSDGLIPVIVQDYKTNQVLMMAYMNEEAYEKTIRTSTMTYFSRSRQSLWVKGETSGHFQYMKSLSYDCDADTLLAKVEQVGAACHTGNYSCFFNDIVTYDFEEKNPFEILNNVYEVISDRKVNPKEGSYTNYLFDKGIDKILKKVGEEATEIVIAAKNPNANEIKYEISDFLYHVMVLMVEKGVTWEEIMTELANR